MPAEPCCLIDLRHEHPDPPPIDLALLSAAVERAMIDDDRTGCALSVLVVDDATSAELHAAHFDDDSTTDVMTFPDGSFDPESQREHLGDIAICADVARRAAAARGIDRPLDELAGEECILYVIHGLLHLLGFDDADEADRLEMWQRQREILAAVGIAIEDRPEA